MEYTGSSSFWDVLPQVTGQYFDTQNKKTAATTPKTAPLVSPAVSASIAQLVPLLVLGVVLLVVVRAIK